MLLATYEHHAAPRGHSRARSGEEARDVLHGRVLEAPLPQGSRPPCLGEPRGAAGTDPAADHGAARRRRAHGSDSRILLCRRWLNSCLTSCASLTRFCLFLSRLSKCPRSCSMTSLCALLCATRSWWKQLVEVPTILSYSSPAADYGAARRHSSSSSWWGESTGLQDFRPGQSSSSSSHVPARAYDALDAPGDGFFRTFPKNKKKCEVGFALGVGTTPRVEPIHPVS